ncbi:MAG: hypothetical protein R3314_06190 [Longimicrobiales bacterium]|nr:hypothetical protein [Longimicrobiales bacterium]
MSRAFVNEDAAEPPRRFALPPVDDPGYDAAAAFALLEGAREGDTRSAEEATGYRWGAEQLRPHVERMLEQERERPPVDRDDRLITVARRFLRASDSDG